MIPPRSSRLFVLFSWFSFSSFFSPPLSSALEASEDFPFWKCKEFGYFVKNVPIRREIQEFRYYPELRRATTSPIALPLWNKVKVAEARDVGLAGRRAAHARRTGRRTRLRAGPLAAQVSDRALLEVLAILQPVPLKRRPRKALKLQHRVANVLFFWIFVNPF